jgi:hypothetical protein
MAAVKPAAGEVLEQTTRTRVLTEDKDEPGRRERLPELWEMVDSLAATTPSENPDYEFTLYRGSKEDRDREWIGKFYERLTREKIQSLCGGGIFNVWLKLRVSPNAKTLTLKYNENVKIYGAPKNVAEVEVLRADRGDPTSQLLALFREEMRALREEMKASRGGDLAVDAMRRGVDAAGQMLSVAATSATGTLQRIAGNNGESNANPLSSPGAALEFLKAAKDLFGTPATNSLQDTLNTLKLFKESGLVGGTSAGEGKLLDKLALSLVERLPALAQYGASIMGQYRAAEEAKVQQAALIRGVPPPQPAAIPVAATPAAPSNIVVMPSPEQSAAQEQAEVEKMLQYIEQKMVELIMNENITPEQAANDALTFIDVTDPVSAHQDGKNLVDQVLAHGEGGLRWIFDNRPTLTQVPKGPRLESFIKTFVEEGQRPPQTAVQTPNPKAPPA